MGNFELYIDPVKQTTRRMSREEAIQYVRDHIDTRPIRLLAEATGYKIIWVYDTLRRLGHGNPDGFDRRDPDLHKKIAELYPDHANKWIAKTLHCGEGTIDRCRKRLGLKKDPEYLKEISRRRSEYGSRKRTQEEIDKCQRSLAKTRMMENFRVNSGMKQKTRLKIKSVPCKTSHAIWYLVARRGYIRTTDPYTIWYDENTRRSPVEDYYLNRYNIKIEAEQ